MRLNKINLGVFGAVVIGLLIIPGLVFAQIHFDPGETFYESEEVLPEESGLGTADPITVASRIINVVLGIIGVFLLVLLVYGGYIWMNARGNEEEVKKAKRIIQGAIIGLIIILASYGITWYVFDYMYATTL